MIQLNILLVTLTMGLCLSTPAISQTTDYCDASLCGTKQHVACNNTGSLAAACTASARIIPITSEISLAIVKKHNTLRNTIAAGGFNGFKPAVRMAPMRWSPELARLAEFNVKQCAMQHDKCRNTAKFKYAGQNLAKSSWTGTKSAIAMTNEHIQIWFKEWSYTSMAIINNYIPGTDMTKQYGHFTSMMQEKSTAVGCAILRQPSGALNTQFTACNYAFTNIINKPVYRRGPVGSNCTTGRHGVFPSLCSLKEVYDVNSPNNF